MWGQFTVLDRWLWRPRWLSTVGAAACIMTLLAVTYIEIRTPLTITISALTLIPTLVAASLLPDTHVVAVLLTAVTCQGWLVLTGDLMPITAATDAAAALLTAGMGRLAAGWAARIWA